MHVPLRGYLVPLLAATALILMGVRARAAVLTDLPCPAVRQAVAYAGGLSSAIEQAKARGYTDAQIERVVARCKLRG